MIDVQEALIASKAHMKTALSAPVPGLNEMTSYLTQSTGKGIRALLLLTAAANPEGKVPHDAPLAAAALELLHMATLVHDDVIDNAATRRGLPALHQKFDTKSAVICGDYLLSQSMLLFSSMDTQRLNQAGDHVTLFPRISRALAAVCQGEYIQHSNLGNLDIHLYTYLKIISGKTAALFSVAAYVGANIGGESVKTAQALGRFGRCLGMAFQIADDCKDYEWTQAEAKKPVGNDIKSGVITLPLIFAMQKDPGLRALAKEVMMTQKDPHGFLQSIRAAGGADAARDLAGRYAARATRALQNILPGKQDAMLAILHDVKVGV